MKLSITKLAGLGGGIVLAFASFAAYTAESHKAPRQPGGPPQAPAAVGAYAVESHIAQALMHAEAAASSTDGRTFVEHAETAQAHAKAADDHLDAGIKSLKKAIEHGRQRHPELAKNAAREAVAHLKAAQ